MEYEGIRLDTDALKEFSQRLEMEIDQLKAEIFEAAGSEFNIGSPKQLGIVLYDDLKLVEKPKKTATGAILNARVRVDPAGRETSDRGECARVS